MKTPPKIPSKIPAKTDDTQAGHRDRMRAKLLERGSESLSEQELLEMLLFLNYRRQDVKPIVKSLFKHFGSLGAICDASPTELARIPNFGTGGIALLLLIKGLFYRLDQEQVTDRSVLSNWQAVQSFCIRRLGYSAVEKFMILYLDAQNGVIADEIISIGTVNRTAVFPREVVKKALEYQAASLIIVHNHPSSSTKPSDADIMLTRRIKDALALVDIALHNHLIVTSNNVSSIKALNLL